MSEHDEQDIAGDPALADRLLRDAHFEASLRHHAARTLAVRTVRTVRHRRRQPQRGRWGVLVAAALVALAIGGTWLALPRQPAAAWLLAGEVPGVAIGDALPAGALNAAGTVQLDLGDAVVTLQGGSQVMLSPASGHRLHIERGQALCAVRKQAGNAHWSLRTPHSEVRVIGTRFTVSVSAARSAVAVSEGVVELIGNGTTNRIAAGEEASLASDGLREPVLHWRFTGPDAHLRNRIAGAPRLDLGADGHALQPADGVHVTLSDSVWSMPGGDDGSRLASRFRASGEITMAAWIRLACAPSTRMPLLDILGMTDASNRVFTVLPLLMDAGDRIAPTAWRHRAVTLDAAGKRLSYGDGRLIRSDDETWSTHGWVGQLHLKLASPRGHVEVPDDPSYRLSVAALTLWDRVLTPEEIAAAAAERP